MIPLLLQNQPQTITEIPFDLAYVVTRLGSHFCAGVPKHHSTRFPLPRSAEHSSLHIHFSHCSTVQSLCAFAQAYLALTCFNVKAGLFFALQCVIPYLLQIFLIVPFEISYPVASLIALNSSFGCSRIYRIRIRSSRSDKHLVRPDRGFDCPSLRSAARAIVVRTVLSGTLKHSEISSSFRPESLAPSINPLL